MTRARIRQSLLGLLLILSLAASGWVYRQEALESDLAEPAPRKERSPASVSAPILPRRDNAPQNVGGDAAAGEIRLDLARLHARELAGTDIDPFRTKSWFVPPPPPPPEPPPKPTAPPLPFQFVGKTEEVGSGNPLLYLANGNEFYTVRVGDKFAGSYQLERIEPGALVIRYLPLSIIQTLPIGTNQ